MNRTRQLRRPAKSRASVRLLAAFASFTISGVAIGRVGASESSSIGDVVDVVTIDVLDPEEPYDKIWEPYIARWSDNHLVVAYGLQVRQKGDMGDIVCSLSQDQGKTWSPRIMIFDHRQRNGTVQFAYNNAVLYRPPGQDIIWLFAQRVPIHYRDSENAELCAAYTADGGSSWHHVEIASDYQGSLVIVAGIESVERDGQTHYLLPAHRNSLRHDPYGDRRQFVLESTSLLHWKLAGYIPQKPGSEVFLHEGNISKGERNGELKMIMRTADMVKEQPLNPAVAYSSSSTDGGKTWSVAEPESELPNYRAKSFYGMTTSGQVVYVYNDNVRRQALWYKARAYGGEWSKPKLFYFDDNRNSYPTLLEAAPDVWLAVWDSSNDPERNRTAIRFGRLDLTK